MKGLSGSRGQHHQLPLPHSPCGLVEFDRPHDIHGVHSSDIRHTYLLSPTDSCAMDYQHHQRYSPRSSIHSDCMMLSPTVLQPTGTADHISSSTFPRMHYGSQYYDSASRDDCATITTSATSAAAVSSFASHHAVSKSNRIPANLLDRFEKQLPVHRDGFHTLQYQRASASEQRSESPGRIRHLVHSVQKLFTKSHSLEGSSKMNGAKGDGGAHHHHSGHHSSKHGIKHSKSKERKHRTGSWWSSDDNLDSDSTFRTPGGMSRHHAGHCVSESVRPHFGDHSLKTSRSSNDVKCSACESLAMPPEGKFMKRSSWSTLTVSQAKEAYRKSSLNLDKSTVHHDLKSSLRASHYLQVPQDEWSGYPGIEKDEEIPCRRMRSSSYVKAMGDDESGDSDTSPKMSPQKAVRPDALVLKSSIHRPHIDSQSQGYHLQTSRDLRSHPGVSLDPATSYHPPQYRSRNQSYMRAVSTLSQASCLSQVSETEVNGQYESVCESVFSEVESQAMEALDLPGTFRTRSHSYLRAIQAGYSQDDDCLPSMTSSTVTSTLRSTTGIQFRLPTACNVERTQEPTPETAVTFTPSYKKTPPPVPPRSVTKPLISVTAQSSTESMQDAYHEGRLPRLPRSRDAWGKYVSTESLDSSKALTLATEGRRLVSTGSYTSVQTCDKAILVSKAEEYLKTPRSSVGIQVEAVTDSEAESKGLPKYQSVGIQVEGEKRHGRFKRSNSVTAAVQADVEHELFRSVEDKVVQFGGFQRHSEPSSPAQYSATRTVRTQGIFTYRDDYRAPSGPPSPHAAAWVEETEETETGQVSQVRADGSWYMQLLHNETKRMEAWCKEMEREAEEHELSEEILGKIRSAVGSAQLLMSQKFQQFYWLCEQNLDPSAMPRPTAQDLAGFWDLLQLSIDDVTAKFDELQKMKRNEWRTVEEPEEKERKWPPPTVKRPPKGRGPGLTRDRSLDLQDRQRQEARRRLMAAKRAASFRQSSVSERADSIEIYIPEAQTRL
ncbi:disks large-associated protein 2 isoform X2 [Tachysurus fulvidraco]|uniref:disks large-associated protein 2 isoform X2 n=1 Tax=Tachysurus fulvidraco TaxID=1234273 RepID=UPI001FED8819|nr:disks large-associated protein 2 isoform X2 [Tachysurus fulvidraco]